MSMYRQLWLAIVVSTLLALMGSLLASLLSARSYLETQLSMKNTDNAAALALTLSQSKPDAVSVELAVSALFDSGHYESIRVVDPMERLIVERAISVDEIDAPDWFARLLPLHATPGQARITDGWSQFGTVILVSHSRFAYAALWQSALQMLLALALAGLLGGALGTRILRRLKAPLGAVIEQAKAITERRFVTIDEPRVPELRQLAAAMNATVVRLKTMFAEEAARLENVRREAMCDALTGLANREHGMARLRALLGSEETAGGARQPPPRTSRRRRLPQAGRELRCRLRFNSSAGLCLAPQRRRLRPRLTLRGRPRGCRRTTAQRPLRNRRPFPRHRPLRLPGQCALRPRHAHRRTVVAGRCRARRSRSVRPQRQPHRH